MRFTAVVMAELYEHVFLNLIHERSNGSSPHVRFGYVSSAEAK